MNQPLGTLLDRAESDGPAGEAFRRLRFVLEQNVNMATHLMGHLVSGKQLATWETVAVSMYRHVIELADAASVLVGHRIDRSCMPLARSIFEAWLGLTFLLESDSEWRSRCYLYCDRLSRLNAAEAIIATSNKPNQEQTASRMTPGSDLVANAADALPGLMAAVGSDKNQEAREAFEQAKKRRRRFPKWYTLCDGGDDLRTLSRLLNREEYYIWLYKAWSAHLHAEQSLQSVSSTPDGVGEIEGFRNGLQTPTITLLIQSMLLACTRSMAESLAPDRATEVNLWYMERIRPHLSWLTGLRFEPPKG